jgi:hypothetical protein
MQLPADQTTDLYGKPTLSERLCIKASFAHFAMFFVAGKNKTARRVTTPTNEFVGIYGLSTDGVKVIWAGHDSSRL